MMRDQEHYRIRRDYPPHPPLEGWERVWAIVLPLLVFGTPILFAIVGAFIWGGPPE